MLAPPPLARPTDAALRRHYLAVASAVSIPVVVQDHPASLGRPDERGLPPRAGRRGAVVPGDQARGGADAAEGRPPGRRLARRHRARRPRRGDAGRGAPPRQPRDDDRVRVPGDPGRRRPALVRGRSRRRGGRVRPLRDADPVREPGDPEPRRSASSCTSGAARSPTRPSARPGCRPTRAPSPTSTTSSAAPGSTPASRRARGRPSIDVGEVSTAVDYRARALDRHSLDA